jgi:hypothetical protein
MKCDFDVSNFSLTVIWRIFLLLHCSVIITIYLKESDDNFGRGSEEYLSLASLLGIVDIF